MTNESDRGGASDLVLGLFEFASGARIAGGIGLILAGGVFTWQLWRAGWVWGYTVVLVPIGIGLLLTGLGDRRRAHSAQREWRHARADRQRLVEGVLAAEARGERPVEWLRTQGIQAPRVRKYVLDHARRRKQAGG